MGKFLDRTQVAEQCRKAREGGKRVVFTSGTFDLLHAGHSRYLEAARQKGELLVVGVNSDSSVRQYKDPLRPILPENDRAALVAALHSVDLVFVFPETNNQHNIELIRPALYVKAGDYSRESLSSAHLVEKYGGEVCIVPFEAGHSTTALIERIVSRYGMGSLAPQAVPVAAPSAAPAVFVDRDGTIIENVHYLHEPNKVRLIPGAAQALKSLHEAGYRIVVVTNQQGIGLGLYSKEDFFEVNREMLTQLSKEGVVIDQIHYCPHALTQNCSCRKPGTAMLERASEALNLVRDRSWVIGDMTSDVKVAKNFGCRGALVRTGYGGSDKRFHDVPDLVGADLGEVAQQIVGMTNPR